MTQGPGGIRGPKPPLFYKKTPKPKAKKKKMPSSGSKLKEGVERISVHGVDSVKRDRRSKFEYKVSALEEKVDKLSQSGEIYTNPTEATALTKRVKKLSRSFHLTIDQDKRLNKIQNILRSQSELVFRQNVIGILSRYLLLRDPNMTPEKLSVIKQGLCHGLTLLYAYYQFNNKEHEFFKRLAFILKTSPKEFDRDLATKRWDQLSDTEKKFEALCNDLFFLQSTSKLSYPSAKQINPLETLKHISDESDKVINNLSVQFQFAALFSKKAKKKSSDALQTVLGKVFSKDADKHKFLMLKTEKHTFGIFYRDNKCYLYNSNDPKRPIPFPFNPKKPKASMKPLVEHLLKSLGIKEGSFVLGMEMFSDELLNETKELNAVLIDTQSMNLEVFSQALEQGYLTFLENFLKKGIFPINGKTINSINIEGFTPLTIAAKLGNLDIVKLLIAHGAKVNQSDFNKSSALWIAAVNEDIDMVELLLDNGADVNDLFDGEDSVFTLSIAMLLAKKTHKNVVELLLQRGADVNALDKEGNSFLMIASTLGNLEVVKLLLKYQAKKDLVSDKGKSALDLALANKHFEIVDLLREE